MLAEWVDVPGTMRRLLQLARETLASDFDWLDENGRTTCDMSAAVLYRRNRDGKLFRASKDRWPEGYGQVFFLEEV
jgi:hypothetical protein